MARYPRVHGVITQQGRDLSSLINREAALDSDADPNLEPGRHPFPPRLLVAQAIAESNLSEVAERWGRRSAEARECIAVLMAAGQWP